MTKPSPSLATLFARERQRLVQRVRRIVGCKSAAEDIAQDTYLKLWQRPLSNKDTAGLLHRTAHNLALDHLRAQAVRQRYQAEAPEEAEEVPVTPDPERVAATLQQWQALIEQLDDLPSRTRQIFLLNRVDGETYAAIAKRLGVSMSTVEKEMMLAMRTCLDWQQQRQNEEKAALERFNDNTPRYQDEP